MKRRILHVGVSVASVLLFLFSPLFAWAEEGAVEEEIALAPVLITEVQTGSATARGDEFIELVNTGEEAINLRGWQVRYITASETSTATLDKPTDKISISPDADVLVPAGHYFVLSTAGIALPPDTLAQTLTVSLPATGGSLVLLRPESLTCELAVVDALAWGTGRLFGKGHGAAGGASSSKDRLLQRFVDAEGRYVDTHDNGQDVASLSLAKPTAAAPSPGLANTLAMPAEPITELGSPSQPLPAAIADTSCTLPTEPEPTPEPTPTPPTSPPVIELPETQEPSSEPRIPAGNIGLLAPQLSELLPNPGAPQTDAKDEFIELYNPNEVPFDLTGYMLEVGTTTKRHYAFPAGAALPARSFVAFFSADTRLALTNNGGQVRLLDPLDTILAESAAYGSAKDSQAWIFANNTWQWTTSPTPNAINVISNPAAKKPTAAKQASTKATGNASSLSKQAEESGEDSGQVLAATTSPTTPLHPSVLAVVGVSALLYGAYEYRRDLANKLYLFRANRAARAAARQKVAGG